MTDDELKRLQDQWKWYDDELTKSPGNQFIRDARDDLAKRIRDELARRRREESQGRLF